MHLLSGRRVLLSALVLRQYAAAQDFDIDAVIAAPDPISSSAIGVASEVVTYNTAAIIAQATAVSSVTVDVTDVASSTVAAARRDVHARSACAPQPSGATGAPTYSPDTASAFLAQSSFGAIASAAPVPSGYNQVFVNLGASNNAYGYLGFTTLQTYDTQACAKKCNAVNGCMAMNIYFERDPSVEPGTGCDNPPSVTTIKCVFWGGEIDASNAVNSGQYRDKFQVVIAGSNGYISQSIATPAGYSQPAYLGNAAINAPYDAAGCNSYLGYKLFTQGAFSVQLCADYCSSQSKYNLAHPPSNGAPVQTCQFFNTYVLYINQTSKPQGQYCAIYSESWSSTYATNKGQYRGSDHYLIEMSYSSSNLTNPGVAPNAACAVAQASQVIVAQTLQPFCTSYIGANQLTTATTTVTTTTPLSTVTTTVSAGTTTIVYRRGSAATGTPTALTQYPSSILSSACSLVATTSTSTSYVSVTATAPTSFTTVTATAAAVFVTCNNPRNGSQLGERCGSDNCQCTKLADGSNVCKSNADCTNSCSSNADCGSGYVCVTGTYCNDGSNCTPISSITQCGNPAHLKRMFGTSKRDGARTENDPPVSS